MYQIDYGYIYNGTDSQTKSVFLFNNVVVIYYCSQNFAWPNHNQFDTLSRVDLIHMPWFYKRKERDLTRSYDKSPYTHRKSKKQRDNTKTLPKPSITQRLQTDLWL